MNLTATQYVKEIESKMLEGKLVVRENGGMKADGGKLDFTLVPWEQFEETVQVLMFGAKKYSADNWKKLDKQTYVKALMRHAIAYASGEITDPESGMNHMSHLMCNALFLKWFDDQEKS